MLAKLDIDRRVPVDRKTRKLTVSLRILSTRRRLSARMTVLLVWGLLASGCARVHLPSLTVNWDTGQNNQSEDPALPAGRQARPDDEKTTSKPGIPGSKPGIPGSKVGIPGSKVAANSAASTQFEPTSANVDEAGGHSSAEKGNVFKAFMRKRVAEEDRVAEDPFLTENTNPFENRQAEFQTSTRDDERLQPVRPQAPVRGQQAPGKENKFVDGFDSQLDRLRAIMGKNTLAAEAEKQKVEEWAAGPAPEEAPGNDGNASDFAKEFPQLPERKEFSQFSASNDSDAVETEPSFSENFEWAAAAKDVETQHPSPVEYLPPPPISSPTSGASSSEMIVNTETVPPRDWRVENREVSPFTTQHATRNDPKWPNPVEFDGSITSTSGREVDGPEEETALARIVPNRSPNRSLQQSAMRVMANKGGDVSVTDTANLPPLLPVDAAEEPGPVKQDDLSSAWAPDIFRKTVPAESLGSQDPADPETAATQAELPPPAENQTEPKPLIVESINWDDEPEVEPSQDRASIPLPVLFGIGVGLAFLIGLVVRRRIQMRANHPGGQC